MSRSAWLGVRHEAHAQSIGNALLLGAAAVLLAPAVIAGIATGEVLRRNRVRWTCILATAPALVALAALAGPSALDRLMDLDRDGLSLGTIVAAGALPWLETTPLIGAWWMVRRDRRDRLHGGRAEQQIRLARGPLDLLAIVRGQRRVTDPRDRITVGVDERGMPVHVLRPRAHVTIVGASNSGKTTTAKLLLAAHVAAGGAVVVLDGKGGHDLPDHLQRLGAEHRRSVALWSPTNYGAGDLDALRVAWNPCSDGSPTEIKDRIASAEPQTEPYYAAIASRGLHAALHQTGEVLTLDRIARLLDQPTELLALLRRADDDRLSADSAWLSGLTDGERSALRGIATRLATMIGGSEGSSLLTRSGRPTIRLSDAVREGWLACFSLPAGSYPELVPHVGRYLLSALNAVAGQLERSGQTADCMVLVDELSAFDGDQLASGLERGRSAGMKYVLATQSLSNFETSGGVKLAAAAIDNAELLIIHRQAVPDAAETLARIAGTEETWEHTHKITDRAGQRFGFDETGDRARRLTDRYRAHPNAIKQLRQGEAILIETRPHHGVRRIRVRGPRDRRR